jgi:hypothetical protein
LIADQAFTPVAVAGSTTLFVASGVDPSWGQSVALIAQWSASPQDALPAPTADRSCPSEDATASQRSKASQRS